MQKEIKRFQSKLTDDGKEIIDPTPVAATLTMQKPIPMEERIARLMYGRDQFVKQFLGEESFDEAMDFGTMEDIDKGFSEEDDIYALNDPHLEAAVEAEKKRLKEKYPEGIVPEMLKQKKATAKPAPAEPPASGSKS